MGASTAGLGDPPGGMPQPRLLVGGDHSALYLTSCSSCFNRTSAVQPSFGTAVPVRLKQSVRQATHACRDCEWYIEQVEFLRVVLAETAWPPKSYGPRNRTPMRPGIKVLGTSHSDTVDTPTVAAQ